MALLDFDPAVPGSPDPYPLLHRLRQEDPIHWSETAGTWVLTRYADAVEFLRRADFSRQLYVDSLLRKYGDEPILQAQKRELVFLDAPEHSRLKKLLMQAFTPRMVAERQPDIDAVVHELVDAAVAKGSFDLIADVAYPVNSLVISMFLGVPPEDRDQLRQAVEGIIAARGVTRTAEGMQKGDEAARFFDGYFDALADRRRSSPGRDLLTALLQAEADGDRLEHQQLLSVLGTLYAAGHSATRNLIGNGMLALLRHPDELARARSGLLATALEEMLRYDSPTQATNPMLAVRDVEIGGRTIRQGQSVIVQIGACNRDPAHFPEPDRFDAGRQPNEHLAFSHGAHFCLGAVMARATGRAVFQRLLERCPSLRQGAGELEWIQADRFRGLVALPLTVSER